MMGYLKQKYKARLFEGRRGIVQVRLSRDGECRARFDPWHGFPKSLLLVEDGEVVNQRILWLLRMANDEATDDDVQVIRDAINDITNSDWIIKE